MRDATHDTWFGENKTDSECPEANVEISKEQVFVFYGHQILGLLPEAPDALASEAVEFAQNPPIPSIVFTLPPVATVGLSEAAAREKGLNFDVKS